MNHDSEKDHLVILECSIYCEKVSEIFISLWSRCGIPEPMIRIARYNSLGKKIRLGFLTFREAEALARQLIVMMSAYRAEFEGDSEERTP